MDEGAKQVTLAPWGDWSVARRWANRITVFVELASIVVFTYLNYWYGLTGMWYWYLLPILAVAGMRILNFFIALIALLIDNMVEGASRLFSR